MKFRLLIFAVVLFTVTGCSHSGVKLTAPPDNVHKTEMLYDKFIAGESPNIAQLNLFFSGMPKGGDLHHHYSGSIYAETFLDWAESGDYRINKETLRIVKASDIRDNNCCLTVGQLRANQELYIKLLTLWSDKDYKNHYHLQLPPDANFFNTFGYFGPVAKNYREGLLILKEQAIKENVSYIETMLGSVDYSYPDQSFDENIRKKLGSDEFTRLLDNFSAKIAADTGLDKKINSFMKTIESAHKDIDDDRFMMRYQTHASRNGTPSSIFSALFAAFTANERFKLLVGVNFVGPENGLTALADYNLHMQMFSYLRKKFPNVNVALHAGELTLGMVPPKDLKYHISQAVYVVGAQRIGHGVDLPYEEKAIELLQRIKEKSAVEINLTSNEFILGVKGREHPYLIYAAYEVPLVICTDDSGVSRNNLSNEYVLLATRYKPGYNKIKKYVYNSIIYSFLSESEKDKLTKALDGRFEKFEAEMAQYSDIIIK